MIILLFKLVTLNPKRRHLDDSTTVLSRWRKFCVRQNIHIHVFKGVSIECPRGRISHDCRDVVFAVLVQERSMLWVPYIPERNNCATVVGRVSTYKTKTLSFLLLLLSLLVVFLRGRNVDE